jgi:hypothetical protein
MARRRDDEAIREAGSVYECATPRQFVRWAEAAVDSGVGKPHSGSTKNTENVVAALRVTFCEDCELAYRAEMTVVGMCWQAKQEVGLVVAEAVS